MRAVNMLEAKSTLSRLVEAIEQGHEREIVIARNGRPAAKLVPIDSVPAGKRIGVAKGKFTVPDDIDAHNADVARLLLGGSRSRNCRRTTPIRSIAFWSPKRSSSRCGS